MPAPRMRDISISRAKPAIRLTIVSPPIVPVDLRRFMGAGPGWSASGFARRRFASAIVTTHRSLLLGGFDLGHVGRGKVDRIEHQWREAGARHRLRNHLAGEREEQPRRLDQEERRK